MSFLKEEIQPKRTSLDNGNFQTGDANVTNQATSQNQYKSFKWNEVKKYAEQLLQIATMACETEPSPSTHTQATQCSAQISSLLEALHPDLGFSFGTRRQMVGDVSSRSPSTDFGQSKQEQGKSASSSGSFSFPSISSSFDITSLDTRPSFDYYFNRKGVDPVFKKHSNDFGRRSLELISPVSLPTSALDVPSSVSPRPALDPSHLTNNMSSNVVSSSNPHTSERNSTPNSVGLSSAVPKSSVTHGGPPQPQSQQPPVPGTPNLAPAPAPIPNASLPPSSQSPVYSQPVIPHPQMAYSIPVQPQLQPQLQLRPSSPHPSSAHSQLQIPQLPTSSISSRGMWPHGYPAASTVGLPQSLLSLLSHSQHYVPSPLPSSSGAPMTPIAKVESPVKASELPSSESKKERRKRRANQRNLQCNMCGATETPEWRRGPQGDHTLCNACGLHYAKSLKKGKQDLQRRKNSIDMLLNAAEVASTTPAVTTRSASAQQQQASSSTALTASTSSSSSPTPSTTTPVALIPTPTIVQPSNPLPTPSQSHQQQQASVKVEKF